jgi:hypothetical protein
MGIDRKLFSIIIMIIIITIIIIHLPKTSSIFHLILYDSKPFQVSFSLCESYEQPCQRARDFNHLHQIWAKCNIWV